MEEIKNFIKNYRGALIGIVIAILILLTNLYKLFVAIILIVLLGIAGEIYYIKKKNKK